MFRLLNTARSYRKSYRILRLLTVTAVSKQKIVFLARRRGRGVDHRYRYWYRRLIILLYLSVNQIHISDIRQGLKTLTRKKIWTKLRYRYRTVSWIRTRFPGPVGMFRFINNIKPRLNLHRFSFFKTLINYS
jgi:hypothetical protein